MDLKQLVVVAFQVSLFVIVLGYGLRADFADLLYLFRRPALLVRSLIAVLVVMPAVAVVLARWFDFTPTVEIALVALAISPLPPLLPTREAKAGGGERYGLGLMVVLALLSIALVPPGRPADRRSIRSCVRRDARNDSRCCVDIDPAAADGRHGDPGRRRLVRRHGRHTGRASRQGVHARRGRGADRRRGPGHLAPHRQRHHARRHAVRRDGVCRRPPAGWSGAAAFSGACVLDGVPPSRHRVGGGGGELSGPESEGRSPDLPRRQCRCGACLCLLASAPITASCRRPNRSGTQ